MRVVQDPFDTLIAGASRYATRKLDSQEAVAAFEAGLQSALKDVYSFNGWPTSGALYLRTRKEEYLASLSWWRRHLRGHYYAAGYDLVADVYVSIVKRFVTGGEGEGWILRPVYFR